MFELFGDQTRSTVALAKDRARGFRHSYIGTEHLLLALLQQQDQIPAQALNELGVDLDDVRTRVEEVVGPGEREVSRHISFTPRAKKILELAVRECERSGHELVQPEHLLLALVSEGEGIAAQALNAVGAGEARVRATVVERVPRVGRTAGGDAGLEESAAERRLGGTRRPRRAWSPQGTVDPAAWPVCASCGTSLSGAATLYRTVAVPGSEGDEILDVTAVYCPFCGATLGVLHG